MAIALDDAPVTLNRPLRDGETLAVTVRRGVGRAGVRLVGAPTAYTVWIETTGIAVLERDGAEQGRVPVSGDAQRVTLTYASGTLTASVGGSAFPPLSDGTAFAGLRAEFVVQGGNGQGSTFDDVTVPLPPGLVMNLTGPSPYPSQVTVPTLTPTPTLTATAGVFDEANESRDSTALFDQAQPLSEMVGTASVSYRLVPAGSSAELYQAIADANAGLIDTIYLNADLPPLTSAELPDAVRTYVLDSTLVLNRSVTIYGNNAILRPDTSVLSPLLHVTGGSVQIAHVRFTQVSLPVTAGTVYGSVVRISAAAVLTLTDSAFVDNIALSAGGGTLFNSGGTVNLRRVTFVGNRAGGGAGIQNEGGGLVTVECGRFTSNTANYGSAILNGNQHGQGGRIYVRLSAFADNVAGGGGGADIYTFLPGEQTQIEATYNAWLTTGNPQIAGPAVSNINTGQTLPFDPTRPDDNGVWRTRTCIPAQPAPIPNPAAHATQTAQAVPTATAAAALPYCPPGIQPPGCQPLANGVNAAYFDNPTLDGTPITEWVTPVPGGAFAFDWGSGPPVLIAGFPADQFSIRWTGLLYIPQTGTYRFHTSSDDGARVELTIDGATSIIIDDWQVQGAALYNATSSDLALTGGQFLTLNVEYFDAEHGARFALYWEQIGEFEPEPIPWSALFVPGRITSTPTPGFCVPDGTPGPQLLSSGEAGNVCQTMPEPGECVINLPVNLTDPLNVRDVPATGAILGTLTASDTVGIYWRYNYEAAGCSYFLFGRRIAEVELTPGWFCGAVNAGGALVNLGSTCANLSTLPPQTGVPQTPTPTPTLTPSDTPDPRTPSATPTLTPTYVPRTVETQALTLHQNAAQFGLPLPFFRWPVLAPDRFQQGFGPNQFSVAAGCQTSTPTASPTPDPIITPTSWPCPYVYTNAIHTGYDFYSQSVTEGTIAVPENSYATLVIAICDGLIVPGATDSGGSASRQTGAGVSLWCFANDPNDLDNDGLRNLSNIVITYNHLSLLPPNMQVTLRTQTDIQQNARIVAAGEVLGNTSTLLYRGDAAHLHLEMFLSFGYWNNNGLRVRVNPRLMFSSFTERAFSDVNFASGYDAWSLQAILSSYSGSFWETPEHPAFVRDLNSYLLTHVPSYPQPWSTISPDCAGLPADAPILQLPADNRACDVDIRVLRGERP
jgi:hypothetical protein